MANDPKGAITNGDSSAPYAVWQETLHGRVLHVFEDQYLAMQFAVNNGLQVIPNPVKH